MADDTLQLILVLCRMFHIAGTSVKKSTIYTFVTVNFLPYFSFEFSEFYAIFQLAKQLADMGYPFPRLAEKALAFRRSGMIPCSIVC